MQMNDVKVTGYFKDITAYTDGVIKTENKITWSEYYGNSRTTFQLDSTDFIQVELDSDCKDVYVDNGIIEPNIHVMIEGHLKTEIARGIGVISQILVIDRCYRCEV